MDPPHCFEALSAVILSNISLRKIVYGIISLLQSINSLMLILTDGFLHLILGGELLDLTLGPAQSLLQLLQHSCQLQPHHRRHITLRRQLGAPAHQLPAQLAQLFRICCIGQAGALGCLLNAVLLVQVGLGIREF
jgi:hypothetical protein